MKILIFKDQAFNSPKDYNLEDLISLLNFKKVNFSLVNHNELEHISRETADILIFPYVKGNFSKSALKSMILFHTFGGSLFFLGDLPHKDNWYPLKNMQASNFHLTRCDNEITLTKNGLTKKGEEIIGAFPDTDFFREKSFSGLRITAFPPDITHPLIKIKSNGHAKISTSIVVIERKCEKFFGAKFAQIGFIGGEPRENVDGAFQKEWCYNPGLLTREWKGINHTVLCLLKWLEPDKFAGSIETLPLGSENNKNQIKIKLRNLTSKEISVKNLVLKKNNKIIFSRKNTLLESEKINFLDVDDPASKFGIYDYELFVDDKSISTFTKRILPVDCENKNSFGFSTYWAFQKPEITDDFKFFCRELKKRGCKYVRVNIPWEDVEKAPGEYNWTTTDQILDFAKAENLEIYFWMFPTTRGSGLSDSGIPHWVLKEPAVDRFGNKGFFPSLWSSFYREHYFGMLDVFTKRYANNNSLGKFILDFGNSDFPYGYHYYGGDDSIFDYSEHERKAFAKYLKEKLKWNFEKISEMFQKQISNSDDIFIPFSENIKAFRVYRDFRLWSIRHGIQEVYNIIKKNAPNKLPLDLPGHGIGAISDVDSFIIEAKAKHWEEEQKFDEKFIAAHNAGKEWGGEAYQVGSTFHQYDESLFQSVRLSSDYYSVPGPDLGCFGDDISKMAFIKKIFDGAKRENPELAVFDSPAWDDFSSPAHVAARLDFPIDIISKKCRFDFSCYKLLVMPTKNFVDNTLTGGSGGLLVPDDEEWYRLLLSSVKKGLNILIFPKTCSSERTFLRKVFEITDIKYSEKKDRVVRFPDSFGGGLLKGKTAGVISDYKPLLKADDGTVILAQKKIGKGSVMIAGYDFAPDSLDAVLNYESTSRLNQHTLLKICSFLEILPTKFDSDSAYVYKEMLHRGDKDFFLLFSHFKKSQNVTITIKLSKKATSTYDISTGESFVLSKVQNKNTYKFKIELKTREGRYLIFQ